LVGRPVNSSALTGGAIAVVLAIFLAVVIARSLSKPLVQNTRAAEGLSTGRIDGHAFKRRPGDQCFFPRRSPRWQRKIRAKQALLENTIESISDFGPGSDEHGQNRCRQMPPPNDCSRSFLAPA